MVVKQSSIADRSEFVITCQGCNRIFRLTPEEIGRSDRMLKTFGMEGLYIYQCVCGNRFNVKFDFRRKTRHACEISSFYVTLSRESRSSEADSSGRQSHNLGRINSVIKNISLDGIGFLAHGRHAIKPNDNLLVKFIISNGANERLLERRVVVRTVSGNYIGAEFFPEDKKKPEIGFFLL